jgi:biopolymer transport protein ExbB/TolQ
MSSFASQIGYYLQHPEGLLYPVAALLLWPVLVVEALALAYVVFEFGRFTVEVFRRDRKRSLATIEGAVEKSRVAIEAGQRGNAVTYLGDLNGNWLTKHFIGGLGDGTNLSRPRLAKVLAETELAATRRLDRTRLWIRLGPIIGLMTTLIPISPALVALAKGDLQTLSSNLVIAFSTTVIGLLISGLAFVMSATRERVYLQDISDIEYALELLGE